MIIFIMGWPRQCHNSLGIAPRSPGGPQRVTGDSGAVAPQLDMHPHRTGGTELYMDSRWNSVKHNYDMGVCGHVRRFSVYPMW